MLRRFYVYIVTNPRKTALYTGVTNNLRRRLTEHWSNRGKQKSFAGKYSCYNLIYYEEHKYINNAIAREKQIKEWPRDKKIAMINQFNPEWRFLNIEMFGEWPIS